MVPTLPFHPLFPAFSPPPYFKVYEKNLSVNAFRLVVFPADKKKPFPGTNNGDSPFVSTGTVLSCLSVSILAKR
jgi:hypothetical protein